MHRPLREPVHRWRSGNGCRHKACEMPASSAASWKLVYWRGLRPSGESGLVLEGVVLAEERRHHRVHGAGHACCAPLGYSGNGGVFRIGSHLGSIDFLDVGDRAARGCRRTSAASSRRRHPTWRSPMRAKQVDIVVRASRSARSAHLQGDRHPMARRRHRQHRVVGPEAARWPSVPGVGVLAGLVDFDSLHVEVRARVRRCKAGCPASHRQFQRE